MLFYDLLDLIQPNLEAKRKDMATRSSDDWIRAEILLASTLRYLAGGSFIDLVDL